MMPIIFASSLLMIPMILFSQLASRFPGNTILEQLEAMFERGDSFTYNVLYVAMIYFFCYFWTAITFNPKDMSENLKNFGTFIPGYRPGKRTADYLEKVMVRITYVGAGFLAGRGHHSHGDRLIHGGSLHGGQFLWWNGPLDCGECRL